MLTWSSDFSPTMFFTKPVTPIAAVIGLTARYLVRVRARVRGRARGRGRGRGRARVRVRLERAILVDAAACDGL